MNGVQYQSHGFMRPFAETARPRTFFHDKNIRPLVDGSPTNKALLHTSEKGCF